MNQTFKKAIKTIGYVSLVVTGLCAERANMNRKIEKKAREMTAKMSEPRKVVYEADDKYTAMGDVTGDGIEDLVYSVTGAGIFVRPGKTDGSYGSKYMLTSSMGGLPIFVPAKGDKKGTEVLVIPEFSNGYSINGTNGAISFK